ncbi:MAG: DUF4405 domain-containing protein [Coriobacteriia bacterium]|nr:DUF4405 domain-containing protein [Coriobacteriia bacterium]
MKIKRDLVIDVIAFVLYVVAIYPRISGLLVHEWLCLGLLLVVLLHTVLHWDWAIDTLKRFLGKISVASRWNLLIDIALFVAFIVEMVSGLLISRHVLLSFGSFAPGYFVWKPVHISAATVLLALVLAHLAMHQKWIFATVRNKLIQPIMLGKAE